VVWRNHDSSRVETLSIPTELAKPVGYQAPAPAKFTNEFPRSLGEESRLAYVQVLGLRR
jgi:hypothetical protein